MGVLSQFVYPNVYPKIDILRVGTTPLTKWLSAL
jgi:hypothetical protein